MVIPDITAAAETLYDATATIAAMQDAADGAMTYQELRTICEDEPCRLNVSGRSPASRQSDGTSAVGLNPVLYLSPAIPVPEGARITVTQNGREINTWLAGTASVYQSHQEIALVTAKARA